LIGCREALRIKMIETAFDEEEHVRDTSWRVKPGGKCDLCGRPAKTVLLRKRLIDSQICHECLSKESEEMKKK